MESNKVNQENKDDIVGDSVMNDFYAPISIPDLSGNELEYVSNCVNTGWISSQGDYVKQFEKNFSNFSGTNYGIGVMNGTVALHLALVALDIAQGDEVIVPDLTFAATINAVLYTGAKPVIVDVSEEDWCISPSVIEEAITDKTKAIIPVHLYGQACDMDAIMKIARKHNLKVVEDCAEAHGAEFNGKKVGSIGDIGCFSFFANKIITTGEGGMCVTNSESLAEKMKILRDHGMSKEKRYWHDTVGYNYRITNLQAAIGCAQLEKINELLNKRNIIDERYAEELKDVKEISVQKNFVKRKKVTWLTSILLDSKVNRDEFIEKLGKKNIDVRPFFHPLSTMPVYSEYSHNKINPVALKLSQCGLNLPTITTKDEKFYIYICQQIREFLEN